MTGIPVYALFLCYWLQLLANVSASSVPLGADVGLAGQLPSVAADTGPTDRLANRHKRQQSGSCQLVAAINGRLVSPSSALVEYSLTYGHGDMEVPANDSLKGLLFSSPDVVFRADHWVRVTSSAGRSLLHLDDNYRALSLGTLAIRTTHVTTIVSDVPEGCLRAMSEEDRKRSIRMLLLNSSSTNSGVYVTGTDKLVEVCNLEATRGSRNEAQFEYVCCSMTSPLEEVRAELGVNESTNDVHLVCYTLTHSPWSHMLTAGIWGLKVIVILFTPLLIPRNLFGEGFAAKSFSYQLPKRNDHQLPETTGASDQTLSLTLTVVKETVTPRILKCGSFSKELTPKLYVEKMEGEEMVHFLSFLDGKGIQRNTVYEVDVDTVMFSIKRRKLLTKWEIPVGFFRLFYDKVLRCHVRRAAGLTACCEANICGESDDNRDNTYKSSYIPWYKLCRLLARLLFLCTLTLPWVLRMTFYYVYEQHLEEDKKRAAARLGVTYSFSGSLALYLTPGHDVFLVLYGMSFTFLLAYEIFDSSFRRDVKKILLASMRDLYSERAKKEQSGQSKLLKMVLSPVRRRGIYGLPTLCVLSPLVVCYLAYYLFPSVNLSVRLLAHLGKLTPTCRRKSSWPVSSQAGNEDPEESDMNMLRHAALRPRWFLPQALYVMLALLFVWSATLLAAECLSFLVEMFIYTLIGLIVNYQALAGYLPFVISVVVYSRGCFIDVYDVYIKYHRALFARLLEPVKTRVQTQARTREERQTNTAFRRVGDKADPPEGPTIGLEGIKKNKLQIQCQGLLVFLDQSDMVYTPEAFFHHTLNLSYYGCPGPFYKRVMLAFVKLSKLIIFLFFALVIVMMFGDAVDLSFTNQFLLSAAANSLPFLQKLFIRHDNDTKSDYSDEEIQFSAVLDEAINNFKITFPVEDLVLKDVRPVAPGCQIEDCSKSQFVLCVPG